MVGGEKETLPGSIDPFSLSLRMESSAAALFYESQAIDIKIFILSSDLI